MKTVRDTDAAVLVQNARTGEPSKTSFGMSSADSCCGSARDGTCAGGRLAFSMKRLPELLLARLRNGAHAPPPHQELRSSPKAWSPRWIKHMTFGRAFVL